MSDRSSFSRTDKLEFDDMHSYWRFQESVRNESRFIWTEEVRRFLDVVRSTAIERVINLPFGSTLYRAQLGLEQEEDFDEEGGYIRPLAYDEDRMRPVPGQTAPGRANAPGMAVLYLAFDANTAIAEIRPWIGSSVSVGTFITSRELRTLDVTKGLKPKPYPRFAANPDDIEPYTAEEKANSAWVDIDRAYSRPVTRDDEPTAYIPTQILTEIFRCEGYDALIYRSALGSRGQNIVLFDMQDAIPFECVCYYVNEVHIKSTPEEAQHTRLFNIPDNIAAVIHGRPITRPE